MWGRTLKKLSYALLATGLMLTASPAMATATPGFALKITGSTSGTGTADTPTFQVTNTSTFTGSAATQAYITRLVLSLATGSNVIVDRVTGFTTPTPPAQTAPGLEETLNTPDSSSNGMGTPGFNISYTGFNAGDASRFSPDFDLVGGANTNFRSALQGATLKATFGNGATQSIQFEGLSASATEFNFVGQDVAAAVPEPAAWAMMIGGFGVVGGSLRRRRSVSTRLAFA